MKLFIYEHITSGALISQPLPASLEHEGNMMLHSIIEDFLQLTDIEVIILRDQRISAINIENTAISCHLIDNEDSFQTAYRKAIQQADYVLAIAPETDDILLKIQQSILAEGKRILGCQPTAISLTTDKYVCYQSLLSAQLSTPITILASEWSQSEFNSRSGYIVKPRDGAGCIDTTFVADDLSLSAWLNNHSENLDQLIIQPYIAGVSISLSLLCSEQITKVLAINHQHLSDQLNAFSFEGCTVNGVDESIFSMEQAENIANQVHRTIKGLWGFVGIDLIVTDTDAMIVDINPRLTTSYIGLHRSLQINPAQLLLTMTNTDSNPRLPIVHRHPVEVLL
jgi:predicted ATP-grasp superfamily ATP-dependent carboligase